MKNTFNDEPKKLSIPVTVGLLLITVGIICFAAGYSVAESSWRKYPEQIKQSEKVKVEPINLSGNSQKATDKFTLKKGLATFALTHRGDSNFSVRLLDRDGNYIDGLVNEIGQFEGSKAVKIEKDGEYLLDVMANGDWSIKIEQ